ncbi:hypothetical protein F5148DRAFT_1285121 [Russula earlei]|uniref:Uncharacterized protein n=1 Tax=Russula earlei TaxID=71964 RepID=A0ACC0U857_9AGAM|nr:hypothetical protein F5148DRAFT_1285121 [Russula earlei]
MTNEELASLEPIIAHAWDQWDHQRRLHYAQQAQAAAGAGRPPDGQPLGEVAPPPPPHTYPAAVELGDAQTTAQPFPPPDPNQHSMPQANDFRALFHRSLLTPSLCLMFLRPPFRFPALPATLPPQFLALSPSQPRPPLPQLRPLHPHSIIAPTSLAPASIVVPAPSSTCSAPSPVTSATVSAPAATVVLISRDTSIAAPLLSKEFKKVQTRAKPGAATEKQTLPPHRQLRRRR